MKMTSRFKIIIAMMIWSTVGLFVKGIDLPSIQIVFFRAIIGSLFLIIIGFLIKEKINMEELKANLKFLTLSGIALGINWYMLFESYKNTTISNATLSYYLAPVFMIILSIVILKENITVKKLKWIFIALIGLFLILKFDNMENLQGYHHIKGITYGIISAFFYALVVIFNKFIKNISPLIVTITQLLISAIFLFLISLISSNFIIQKANNQSVFLLIIVGIVHTGIAMYLYFSSIKDIEGQSIAILSYIDPIFALIISWIILGESMNLSQMAGGALILSSAYFSEKS